MACSPFSPADLNWDGSKTSADIQIITSAVGTCFGDTGYVGRADMDRDGCITAEDVAVFTDIYEFNFPDEPGNHTPSAKAKNVYITATSGCSFNISAQDVDDGSSDPDGDEITLSLWSSRPIGPGTNAVVLTATDAYGAAQSAKALVIVEDLTPPALTCPETVVVTGDANCHGVVPDVLAQVSVSDSCSSLDQLFLQQTPSAGTSISSNMVVTVTATDFVGNQSACDVLVQIALPSPPTVACATVLVVAPSAQCSSVATFAPTATDACGRPLQANCVPASGSVFHVGTTTVTATASDDAGHTGTCTFTVTVRDVTAPTIASTSRVEARSAPGESWAVVDYPAPLTADACGATGVVCSPASGSVFLLGATSVTCTATDTAGNQASSSFYVYVRNSGDCLGVGSQLGQWKQATTNGTGSDQIAFAFLPDNPSGTYLDSVSGDWNGDGVDTIGLVYTSIGTGGTTLAHVYLRNANTGGAADAQFAVTLPSTTGAPYVPLAGDWDGDGDSTLAFYRPATGVFYVRNSNTTGAPDFSFAFGAANSIPLKGDWNGDGTDSVGVYVASSYTFSARQVNSAGSPDVTLVYSAATATLAPVSGDWDGDSIDTLGFIGAIAGVSGNIHLHSANTVAPPALNFDLYLGFGRMLSGNWDGNTLPYVRTVSPMTCIGGQSQRQFTFAGNDLSTVSDVVFVPSDGISVGSITTDTALVTAIVSIAPDALVGPRTVHLDSSGGASNSVLVVVRSPGGLGETDTVGLVDVNNGSWLLRNSNTPGPASSVFYFSPYGPSLTPLRGDWDGDGIDTPGWFNSATNTFWLRNSNSAGPVDLSITFNVTTLSRLPVTGDWNGDGTDTVGLFETSTGKFYLRTTNSPSSPQTSFVYRPVTGSVVPVIGDWDGNGTNTIGVYHAATGTFYLRNSNSAGATHAQVQYGPSGSSFKPVVGDWNGDLTDTLGLYDPVTGAFFFRNSNSGGAADLVFTFGPGGSNYVALVGDWDALGSP
ncbi:MAG: HYR domain-containing protein [Blastocatellia bacterium]